MIRRNLDWFGVKHRTIATIILNGVDVQFGGHDGEGNGSGGGETGEGGRGFRRGRRREGGGGGEEVKSWVLGQFVLFLGR